MTTRILFVALGIVWVVALAGLVWMMTLAQLRPHHALLLLINLQLVMKACVVLSVVSAGIGIVSLRAGARPGPWIGIGGAFGWGGLGALYGAANARNGLIQMNPPIPFAIYSQAYAEALIVLMIGLTGALLGLGLLSRRRPA
ncbi:MAG: hypothetical protein EON96_04775 [Caulobacteraceae bacterium]|nr:MAG: hypothetical protein EON96_04775 [Caulobacteraceae bacterium]